jgi:hypothetical protein
VISILDVSIRRTTLLLLGIALLLTLAGAAVLYVNLQQNPDQLSREGVQGFARLFDLASEANIPTWFKSTIFVVSSLLLWTIWLAKKAGDAPYARHWRDLSVVFALLSIDEVSTLHEEVSALISETMETSGVFLFGWVILGILFVSLFVILYFNFLRSLPRMPRTLFILSGSIYVGAVLGLKMVEGWYLASNSQIDLVFIGLITAKQFLQMFGAILFLYALLGYTRYNVEEGILHITD